MGRTPPREYVPPKVECLGTLAELTEAHSLLPTHTPMAFAASVSSPSVPTGGNTSGGGPITTTAPSGGSPTITHPITTPVQPGPGAGGHHVPPAIHHHGNGHGHGHLHHAGNHHAGNHHAAGTHPGNGVLNPPAAPGGTTHATGGLPFTGFAAIVAGGIGAAAAGAGAALRRLTRRSDQHG